MAEDFFSGIARGLSLGHGIQDRRASREQRALQNRRYEEQLRLQQEDRARAAKGREALGKAYSTDLNTRLDGNTLSGLATLGVDPSKAITTRESLRTSTRAQTEHERKIQFEDETRRKDKWGLQLGAIKSLEGQPELQAQLYGSLVQDIERSGLDIPDAFKQFNPANLPALFRIWGDYDQRLKRQGEELKNKKTEAELRTGDDRKIVSTFTEDGREIKGYMEGDKFVPVGGAKADKASDFTSVNLQNKSTGEIIAVEKGSAQHRQAIASGQYVKAQGTTNAGSDFKEAQAKSAQFANTMEAAEQTLTAFEERGVHTGNLGDATAAALPGGNFITTEDGQRYRQAQANWVRAKLRKESGAVIGKEEMAEEIVTYFPQPGDTPATIEQKRLSRIRATEGMKLGGGGATEALSKTAPIPSAPLKPQSNAQPVIDGQTPVQAVDGSAAAVPQETAPTIPLEIRQKAMAIVEDGVVSVARTRQGKPIDAGHIELLLADPSPETKADFDKHFNDPGLADYILGF